MFGRAGFATGRRRAEPDWAALARGLKRPGVTMMILWEEYRESNQDGYGYSRFCDLLRGFERRLSPVTRQHHVAGEKAFVDYSGKRIPIVDPTTGRPPFIRPAKTSSPVEDSADIHVLREYKRQRHSLSAACTPGACERPP